MAKYCVAANYFAYYEYFICDDFTYLFRIYRFTVHIIFIIFPFLNTYNRSSSKTALNKEL